MWTSDKAEKYALKILIVTSLVSIFIYVATAFGIEFVKYLALLLYLYLIFESVRIFKLGLPYFRRNRLRVVLLFLFWYPLIYISIDLFQNFSIKNISDGYVIYGGYYFAILTGLCLAVLSVNIDLSSVLHKYLLYTIPISLALVILSFSVPQQFAIPFSHLPIVNYLIPYSILTFYKEKSWPNIAGWLSIFLIIYLSSRFWSRSYFLVGILLLIFSIFNSFKGRQRYQGFLVLGAGIALYFFGVFSFLTEASVVRESSILEKYELNSLWERITVFSTNWDWYYLFLWEGNSRALILEDAFSTFTTIDWLFGVGIFGKYISFVERSTIELGWAQDLFRFGFLFLIPAILIFIFSIRFLRKMKHQGDIIFKVFALIIFIKFVDGFVYGIQQISTYNIMVFWGIGVTCLKLKKP